MLSLPGYQITEELYCGARTLVYRGYREQDRAPMIFKTIATEYPTQKDLARLQHEYALTKDWEENGSLRSLALVKHQNTQVLILQDIGGVSLNRLLATQVLPLGSFLTLALALARSLSRVHQRQLIHKDIKPANLVVNLETSQVQIIDFGIASQLSRETTQLQNPGHLEGTLAYISPEQTGRMNRAMDYRTDFYSLGASFYEMLTGAPPFGATDPMELVHCHLARTPKPPHELRPEVPTVLSALVLKLMTKTAEDRYQSAFGLIADLENCLQQFGATHTITAFALGQHDVSERFHIPQKLYGRETEVSRLLAAFLRAGQGQSELLLVAGYSGVGKTALVHELHKPIAQQRGYFISGKFDQFQRNIPYASLIQAFQELVKQLLAETEEQVARWKTRLLHALGPNGQVVIEMIPEVEWIVGKQPAVQPLPPAEASNRFHLVFQNFVRTFATPEHPLVIVLDDLQWADAPSLKLIELLLTDPDMVSMLIVGAYRDNEVSPAHPLMLTLHELQKAQSRIETITLTPLALEQVNLLIADTLHRPLWQTQALAELCLEKTQGNPFFLNQFLLSLHEERWIEFITHQGVWSWDMERIRHWEITDNVVELMAGKLQKLPETTQQVLKLAACIGNRFDLMTLAIVNEQSPFATAHTLWEALQEGLVLPLDDAYKFLEASDTQPRVRYRFLHDRVQLAAYSLIAQDHKKAVHLKVGRLLLDNATDKEQDERLFDIVNHLNTGRDLMGDPVEREKLARLNLQAGIKAKASTAYQPAAQYLAVGMELLEDNPWERQYDLTFALYKERAQSEYLAGNLENSGDLLETALAQARSAYDKTDVYAIKINQMESVVKYAEALNVGLEALKLYDVHFPTEADALNQAIGAEFAKVDENLQGVHIANLVDLPVMQDKDQLRVMKLLDSIIIPCLNANIPMLQLTLATMTRISLKRGIAKESAYAFSFYAALVGSAFQRFEFAYELGELATELINKYQNVEYKAKVWFWCNISINVFRRPLQTTIPRLKEAFQIGLETGDIVTSGYIGVHTQQQLLISGCSLHELSQDVQQRLPFLRKLEYMRIMTLSTDGFSKNMQGHTQDTYSFSYEGFIEDTMLAYYASFYSDYGRSWYHTDKMRMLFLFENHDVALEHAHIALTTLGPAFNTLVVPECLYYHSLILCALYSKAAPDIQAQYLGALQGNQMRMKTWADNCEANFFHKYALMEAEIARCQGRNPEAMEFYQQAIDSARQYGFQQHEALASELYAKFWLAQGRERYARLHLMDAAYLYERWGAARKLHHLREKYPQLLLQRETAEVRSGETATTSTTPTMTTDRGTLALDMDSFIKASQVIAGEIKLERLLDKMLRIMIENGGAQKGVLLLPEEKTGHLVIQAEGQVDAAEVSVLQAIPLTKSSQVCTGMIQYVARSKENLVLHDACHAGAFQQDPYVQARQLKSVLCAPILHQGRITAVIYLENNLTTGAFTPDRLEVLHLLSSQTAISLENASLYANLEKKVKQRTAELEVAHQQILVLQKETTEKQMAGGFAHEIRNALVGPKLITDKNLGLDGPQPHVGLNRINSRIMKDIYLSLQNVLGEEELQKILQSMKLIFANEERMEKGFHLINQSLARALAVTGQIMDYSRIGQETTGTTLVDCDQLIARIIEEHDASFREKNIQIQLHLRGQAGHIQGHEGHFYRVVNNLVLNARDAVLDPGNKGKEEFVIEITSEKLASTYRLRVRDNGIGISKENSARIYDAFFSTKPESGTGLGLGMVQKIVSLYHGTIAFQSEPGKGTAFTVNFPIQTTAQEH